MKKNNQELMHNALQAIVDKYEKNDKIMTITKKDNAIIFNVDMIFDFTYTSAFKNPLAVKLIPKLEEMLKKASKAKKKNFHVIEAHSDESVEFLTFPHHGKKGTKGGQIVEPLDKIPYDRAFYKNSTNGIHNDDIKRWIDKHPEVDVIIVDGVLADMCAMQFAIGLKTYCNEINRNVRVIVPYELIEASDYEGHNRDLFYYMALEFMAQAGIEIVKNVDFE